MDAGANVPCQHEPCETRVGCGDDQGVCRQALKRGSHIGVLFDLTGPSIRTGDLPEPFTLADGDVVEFRKTGSEPNSALSTTVNYDGLDGDVRAGTPWWWTTAHCRCASSR